MDNNIRFRPTGTKHETARKPFPRGGACLQAFSISPFLHDHVGNPAHACTLRYKLSGKISNRRPRTATKSLRKRYEGPWVWLASRYREERYLFSTHIVAPCFLTFVRRVHSQTFEGDIGAPRFLASEWFIGNRIDRVMSERDAAAGA